jgi:hypothetical protein
MKMLYQAHNLKVIGSNPIPATTFVITHSPSRSDRRDGFGFSEERSGRATEQVRCWQVCPGPSRMTGGHLLSTKHLDLETPLAAVAAALGGHPLAGRSGKSLDRLRCDGRALSFYRALGPPSIGAGLIADERTCK